MSKINGCDDKNKRVVVDIIARHWNIFRDLLMLADITNVSRDIVHLAHNCAILRPVHIRFWLDPNRVLNVESKDALIESIIDKSNKHSPRNVTRIALIKGSRSLDIYEWCNTFYVILFCVYKFSATIWYTLKTKSIS